MIDINILPQKAQNELIDFYLFLVERYVSRKRNKKTNAVSSSKEVNDFFNQFNLDFSGFSLNRNELYER